MASSAHARKSHRFPLKAFSPVRSSGNPPQPCAGGFSRVKPPRLPGQSRPGAPSSAAARCRLAGKAAPAMPDALLTYGSGRAMRLGLATHPCPLRLRRRFASSVAPGLTHAPRQRLSISIIFYLLSVIYHLSSIICYLLSVICASPSHATGGFLCGIIK